MNHNIFKTIALYMLVAVIVFGCATISLAGSKESVEKVVRTFADCWNRHDMEAFAQLFTQDAEFVNVVGLWWKGREEIKQAHIATHTTMFKNSHLAITNIDVRFLKPDVAIARSRWELTGHVGPSGEPLPQRKGILMNLIVRTNDKWMIIDSQNTDIIEGVLSRPQ